MTCLNKQVHTCSKMARTEKEAAVFLLDIGPSMNQAPDGSSTSLQTAINAITMIIQRKIFAESKDEVALVLFGTPNTANALAQDEEYQNISLAHPLGPHNWELLKYVQDDIQPSNISADVLDATVVAIDHLKTSTTGKKGYASRRLIIFSDLGGEFSDNQLNVIIGAMKSENVDLNVIGPNLGYNDDEDDDTKPSTSSGRSNGVEKQKTPQQRAGTALMRHLVEEVGGACYSFSDVLPAISFFQSKIKRPFPVNYDLDVGAGLHIPISCFVKTEESASKVTFKSAYARDIDQSTRAVTSYHLNDEEETEVAQEDTVKGHRYGSTLVPFSKEDEDNMKFKTEKCFKLLGFTKSTQIKLHHYLGKGCRIVTFKKEDPHAAIALSAFIHAMYETDMVAIVRQVFRANCQPKIGFLAPHIKKDYECLIWIEVPYMEDLRQFTFGSLPTTDDVQVNKKFKPSSDQLNMMDKLIDGMDLSEAIVDEDGDTSEALKPKVTLNCYLQRLFHCLQHRVLNPDDPIPDLPKELSAALEPPQEVACNGERVTKTMKDKFKLEVKVKPASKKGNNLFAQDNEDEVDPKRPHTDNDLSGGMAALVKGEVEKVGSITPVEDFLEIINRTGENKFQEASMQLREHITQLVMNSFGNQMYSKAFECYQALREQCIKMGRPQLFNSFIKEFKPQLLDKNRKEFWDKIASGKLGLISATESDQSGISKADAAAFIQEVLVAQPTETAADEEDEDDLLDEL